MTKGKEFMSSAPVRKIADKFEFNVHPNGLCKINTAEKIGVGHEHEALANGYARIATAQRVASGSYETVQPALHHIPTREQSLPDVTAHIR